MTMIKFKVEPSAEVQFDVVPQLGGGVFPEGTEYVTENGTYDVTLKQYADVQIPDPPLQNKNVTENGTITADEDYYGLDTVIVDVPQPSGNIDIAQNGTVNVTDYETANVDVQPMLQSKNVTENGTVTADEGYDGLSAVNVNVPVPPAPLYQERRITENGTYYPETGYDAINKVEVSVDEWLSKSFHDNKDYYWLEMLRADALNPGIALGVHGKIVIDWGDGTEPETITKNDSGTATTLYRHQYSAPGRYILSIEPITVDGVKSTYNTTYRTGASISTFIYETTTYNGSNLNAYYKSCLRKVEINVSMFTGTNVTYGLSAGAFSDSGLQSAYVKPAYGINTYTFLNCRSLRRVETPGIQAIGAYAFDTCLQLSEIAIPSTVTSIGNNAFSSCYSCGVYDFTAFDLVDDALPITFGTNVFNGIRAGSKILFNDAATAAVAKTTTNLATYASYITYPEEVTQ